jgi:hypothetical protein
MYFSINYVYPSILNLPTSFCLLAIVLPTSHFSETLTTNGIDDHESKEDFQ